jgi:hypothetical protein
VFTLKDRERVPAIALERARTDDRIIGAALTGSAAQADEDRWSDIDLFLGVADGIPSNTVVCPPPFRCPVWSDSLRVFLIPGCLEVDVAFAPATEFGALGPEFRVVFGTPVERQKNSTLDLDDLIGRGWHHVLHARACIERSKPWQAEYWISALRDYTLTLACAGSPDVCAGSVSRIAWLTRAMLGNPLVAHEPEFLKRHNRGAAHDEHDRDEPEHGDADPDHTRQMHAMMFAV